MVSAWGLAWPPEYGGLGRSAIDQWIFVDELESAGAPMLPLTVTSVAPTIMSLLHHGRSALSTCSNIMRPSASRSVALSRVMRMPCPPARLTPTMFVLELCNSIMSKS